MELEGAFGRMISTRSLWVLATLLVLLCALDWATRVQREVVRETEPLFDPFTAEQVVQVEVENPKAPEGQRTLRLARHGEGHWVLENHHGFPVREGLTDSLVRGLAALTTLDLLTEDPSSHSRYGVQSEAGVRITLRDAQGRALADLYQGDLAPGGRARYVRRRDSDAVYRAPHFDQRAPVEWAPWTESRWMPLDRSLVQRLRLQKGSAGPELVWELKPGSRLQWQTAGGEPVPRSQVEALLTALSRITLRELQGAGPASWAGASETLTVELDLAGNLRWSGRLGPEGTATSDKDPAPATVERKGVFRVGLAPQAVQAFRRALPKW